MKQVLVESEPVAGAPGRVGLVLAAAGSGSRLGAPKPKQFLEFRGRPLYQASLRTLLPLVDEVVVVVPAEEAARVAEEVSLLPGKAVIRVTAGGRSRQDSVEAGVNLLGDRVEWVLVHDAARPLVSQELARRVLDGARQFGACLPVVPVADTVKEVRDGKVVRTIPRADVALAQTPQGFALRRLQRALGEANQRGLVGTDEAMLAEEIGEVVIVSGEPANVKVTWPEDLVRLERDRPVPPPRVRVGQGFDFHPFAAGRPLWLGGVLVPCGEGLDGHSDADVLVHALMDALLGAVGEEDIGSHFPNTDPRFRGISSLELLREVVEILSRGGFRIGNADVTLLAEKPRILPHVPAMRAVLSEVLGVQPDQVAIKATTMEGRGMIGRGEGIAAQAVVLVYREGLD